mgnify:CR=1 FL=1
MKQVLRIGGSEITHVLACVTAGQGQYLTKRDHTRFLAVSDQQVIDYYSGDREVEYDSLIDDVAQLVSGELSLDTLKLRLTRNSFKDKVLQLNGE